MLWRLLLWRLLWLCWDCRLLFIVLLVWRLLWLLLLLWLLWLRLVDLLLWRLVELLVAVELVWLWGWLGLWGGLVIRGLPIP